MGESTKIQWADATFNPWIGCAKVSPGCKNCYAENTTRARVLRSQGQETWGKGAKRSRTSAANWRKPLQWNHDNRHHFALTCEHCNSYFNPGFNDTKEHHFCRTCGRELRVERPRIFPSLCDWLDDEVPIEWLADFLKLIHETPNLDWLLLTKRPENFRSRCLQAIGSITDGTGEKGAFWQWILEWIYNDSIPQNVWLGTSVENQAMADLRIPQLLQIPAKIRFLSIEPLLGPVDLRYPCFNGADAIERLDGIHWVIVGGESGPGVRPCNVQWIRSIVKQCKAASIPPFVKQLGSHCIGPENATIAHEFGEDVPLDDIRWEFFDRKGGDPSEWPQDLRVREFPL